LTVARNERHDVKINTESQPKSVETEQQKFERQRRNAEEMKKLERFLSAPSETQSGTAQPRGTL
jgi:hypothetical protein